MAFIAPLNIAGVVAPAEKFHSSYIYPICIVVALGGVLFGFDLVIISGTIPFFTKYFQLNEINTGWAVGCINVGAALGALVAGKLSDAIGRKKLLLICSFLFALTGVATGWAPGFNLFIVARLLSGVAVGVAALVCPMYIAEIAPAALRGRLVTFYQLAIVTGLLLAYLSNYLLLGSGENNWRWMFSSQTLPALLFFGGLLFVPESPRWLIKKNRATEAVEILTNIGGRDYATTEAANINKSFTSEVKEKVRDLFKKDVVHIVMIGVAVAFFSQADGQNSLFSYAPVIFKQAGMAEDAAFLQSVIIGVINFIFTFIAIIFIDKIGRRKLLLYGSLLLALDALALAYCFYVGAPGYFTLLFVLSFIAIYAATLGPVTWVILSEIFPNRIRSSALGLATLVLWIANFITTASFPVLKAHFGLHITFAIHAGICLLYFLFIRTKIPETKGKSLEEIELQLTKKNKI
ncbi:MAG: sugar porter family MFS transporter [Ferruginibacter sp.]|nr:sugar porter family MFS transporter [Ferruginibacter sp.]